MRTHQDVTFYVQIEPEWGQVNALVGAKALRITQTRPLRPAPGTVVVKLTVRVPSAAFLPLQPEAVVVSDDMPLTTVEAGGSQ